MIGVAALVLLAAAGGVWWWTGRLSRTPITDQATPVQRNLTRLTFGSGLQTDVTFSPDGRFIAYAADRAGNFDIYFNYDRIEWEAGDASGGSNGLGGISARAGYSNGSGSALELTGSGVAGSFLDSNTTGGLILVPCASPPMVCLATAWNVDSARSALSTPWFSSGWMSVLAKTPQRPLTW